MNITPKENMLLTYQHKIPEYMPSQFDFNWCFPSGEDFINETIFKPGDHRDWYGQLWHYDGEIRGATPVPDSHVLEYENIGAWRDYIKFPNLDELDWEKHSVKDTLKWDRELKFSRVVVMSGVWERFSTLMDFTGALTVLMINKEESSELLSEIADFRIKLHERIIDYYNPDVLVMHDDFGMSGQMIMSPDLWREMIKPHLSKVIKSVTDRGVLYEHHSCGYFKPIIPDLIELGAVGSNGFDPSNDIEECKKNYGNSFTIVGGFDNTLFGQKSSSEQEIRQHIKNIMDIAAPDGGFIPYNMRKGFNEDIINNEIENYGNNFYGIRPEKYQIEKLRKSK